MMSERCGREDAGENSTSEAVSGVSRRDLLSAAASGFALAAGGLFLPAWLDDASAREGANDGEMGGRHGRNRRGRDSQGGRGRKRDKHDKQNAPGNRGRKDVDIVLITGNTAMDVEVWQQDPENDKKAVLKWPRRTVAANTRVEFLGSEPRLALVGNYVGESQNLFFQCFNPELFGTPTIWIGQGYWSKTGQVIDGDVYVHQPISEGEYVAIDGFRVDRVTDSGLHKIFVINATN